MKHLFFWILRKRWIQDFNSFIYFFKKMGQSESLSLILQWLPLSATHKPPFPDLEICQYLYVYFGGKYYESEKTVVYVTKNETQWQTLGLAPGSLLWVQCANYKHTVPYSASVILHMVWGFYLHSTYNKELWFCFQQELGIHKHWFSPDRKYILYTKNEKQVSYFLNC